jgi:hypothetical protein
MQLQRMQIGNAPVILGTTGKMMMTEGVLDRAEGAVASVTLTHQGPDLSSSFMIAVLVMSALA